MGLLDKIVPGRNHGLDDYLIVNPDDIEPGDESDVVVIDGVPDEPEDDA